MRPHGGGEWDGWLGGVRYAAIVFAVIFFVLGARQYDLLQFLGIRQIQSGADGIGLTADGGIDMGGVLAVVRHPWYLGVVLIIWARDLAVIDLVVSAVLTAYIVIGTLLEERKLVAEYGSRYRDYQQSVSMLVPWKWLQGRINSRRGHP